jgi:hypothetical protein
MIKNQSKKFTIIDKAKLCTSIGSKALGFMFRIKKPKEALIFVFGSEKRTDLHMLFVFFPIDVLFLDKNKRVVDVKKNFKPFTYYAPKAKAMYVIELPAGVMGNTNIGDKITFN